MTATHRHTDGPEHEFEPQFGLPERLPATEQLLWQGSPDWRVLAHSAFHLRKLAVYFVLMMALRGVVVYADSGSLGAGLTAALWLLPLAGLGLGLVAVIAWLSARGTVYTLTDRRIVMRIGIVLTITFNLPLKRITGADLARLRQGFGDVSLKLQPGGHRIGWLQLWPHARAWRLTKPEPTLRAIPQAADVAARLTEAWTAATGHAAMAQDAADEAYEAAPRPVLQGQ